MRRIINVLVAFTVGVLMSCQDSSTEKKDYVARQPLMTVEQVDAEFIAVVNDIVNAEIIAGKLAMAKGADKRIKNFGRIMVKDYTKGWAKLVKLADAKRIPLTDTLTKETQVKIAALNNKTGKDFDRAYIEYITADHRKAITIFKRAQKNCFDKEIKKTAGKGILVFERHLEAIFSIRDSMR